MIYINGRFLTQRITGVNRFAYEMCNAMQNLGFDFIIVVNKKYILDCYDISKFKIVNWGFGKSHFWEQLILPFFFITKRNYVLINYSGLGTIFLKKQIITIHDLSFLYNSEWFSKLYFHFYSILTPIQAKKALKILTVSEFSKNEIIRLLKLPSKKIAIIYNAVSENFNHIKTNCNINKDYILAVSSIDPRKNFETLIKAINLLSFDTKLYIIGDSNAVFRNTKISKSLSVEFLGRVSDSELINFYKNARLFVYPSLYEGFGLPPLEAISSGCCTIVSNINVFKEIFEDAVGYFDPNNAHDIKRCIESYYFSDELRHRTKCNFKRIESKFSWNKSAKILINELNNIN